MEIKFKEGDSINIPKNCVAKIVGNVVVFEPQIAKFKNGDFVKTNNSYIIVENAATFKVYVELFLYSKNIYWGGLTESVLLDLMTDSEKQILLDKLHENGKDWDSEKLEIVDWTWRPKAGDLIWSINSYGLIYEWKFTGNGPLVPDPMDFRTRELAEAALEQLKKAKHF